MPSFYRDFYTKTPVFYINPLFPRYILSYSYLVEKGKLEGTDVRGQATKTADYYRSNYNTEFTDSENAPWWGQHEY